MSQDTLVVHTTLRVVAEYEMSLLVLVLLVALGAVQTVLDLTNDLVVLLLAVQ